MCFSKPKTIEEIIAGASAGMNDDQKAQFSYELNMQIFDLLGRVDGVETWKIDANTFIKVAMAQYPTITGWDIPDSEFTITTMSWMQKILSKDWTNKVPYTPQVGDCDKFANRLYMHLCDFYGINSGLEIWGNTSAGRHGFNLTVFKDSPYLARLIEPQTDAIFIDQGPLGKYTPDTVIAKLAVIK